MESLFKEYEGVFVDSDESQVLEAKKDSKRGDFNPFAIADAVGKKTPKESWIEYTKALFQGVEAEELHARVISKIRDIMIVNKEKQEDTTMHPFVYKKAKQDSKNWKEEELKEIYKNLVNIYHESRMGGEELSVAMEKLLLSL